MGHHHPLERLFGVVPAPALIMVGAFVLTGLLLHRTAFGQHLYAIGGNREAARYVGIPLVRRETAVNVICSLLAGLAGSSAQMIDVRSYLNSVVANPSLAGMTNVTQPVCGTPA